MPLLSGTLLFLTALAVDLGAGLAHRRGHHRWALLGWVLTVVAILGLVVGSLAPKSASAVTVPDQDLAKILASAGFHDQGLVTGLEIIFAESGGNSTARNQNSNGTTDRGIWQINTVHAQVSDQCADDPICATKFAFQLSKSGTDWHDWTTYNTGAYQRFSQRAHAAVSSVAPGCDLAWDPQCPVKLTWQGVVGTGTGTANAVSTAGLPALPNPLEGIANLPAEVLAKMAAKMIAALAKAGDLALLKAYEGLWSAMLAGEDSIGSRESWGNVIVFDFAPVHRMWAISVGIAEGSFAVLLLTLGAILLLLRAGQGSPQHEIPRQMLYVFAAMILIASSFFLIEQVIAIDNWLVQAVNSQVALELRQLSVYQGISDLKDPDLATSLGDLVLILIMTLAAVIICLEMGLVVILYSVRAVMLVALTVVAPFAILCLLVPQFRGVTIYWARLFISTVLVKFVNALIFASFLLLSVTAQGVFNPILLFSLLLVMLMVPGALFHATGQAPMGYAQAHGAVRTALTYEPLRAAGRVAWGGLRSRMG